MSTARNQLMTPHMQRAVDFLAHGEWRDREAVLDEMGKAIPPGMAIRFQEASRLNKRKDRVNKGLPVRETSARTTDRSSWYLVTTGRRAIALKSLHTARRIESEVRDGKTWVRLRPPQRYVRKTSSSQQAGPQNNPQPSGSAPQR